MTRPLKDRFGAVDLAAGLALLIYVGFISYAALRPPADGPGIVGLDKLLHAGAFTGLFVLAALASRGRHLAAVVIGCLIYGGAIELAQGLMPYGREPSLADGVANAVGIAIGFGVWRVLNRVMR
ncbi:MAG: VanZ family protein [Pseudomonadota bacterium]